MSTLTAFNPLVKALDLRPGDVIEGIITDYTSPDQTKIKGVIKLTEVARRGEQVRLFGYRLTTNDRGRKWSTTWVSQNEVYYIPF